MTPREWEELTKRPEKIGLYYTDEQLAESDAMGPRFDENWGWGGKRHPVEELNEAYSEPPNLESVEGLLRYARYCWGDATSVSWFGPTVRHGDAIAHVLVRDALLLTVQYYGDDTVSSSILEVVGAPRTGLQLIVLNGGRGGTQDRRLTLHSVSDDQGSEAVNIGEFSFLPSEYVRVVFLGRFGWVPCKETQIFVPSRDQDGWECLEFHPDLPILDGLTVKDFVEAELLDALDTEEDIEGRRREQVERSESLNTRVHDRFILGEDPGEDS